MYANMNESVLKTVETVLTLLEIDTVKSRDVNFQCGIGWIYFYFSISYRIVFY